ncbi:MAG: caspase family protein [Deltaproteobacteria bacterium]|nr:caspase family protein [Deltaproteobacteria bacterium]
MSPTRCALALGRAALVVATWLAALGLLTAGTARAETRWAVIVGANRGGPSLPTLRFAERDAERIASVFQTMGGFDPSRVVVLRQPTAATLTAELDAISRRIAAAGASDAVLVFYYSGHADTRALLLDATPLELGTLRAQVESSPAAVRVMILDACRSGVMTRVKGGTPGPSFAIRVDDDLASRGLAILTSSAAGENAQESDELGASYFTHHLASALIGAADANLDGQVTLAEAFNYAAVQTLAATSSTLEGPQHPTYRLDLAGRRELALTRPGQARGPFATVTLDTAGSWLFTRDTRPVGIGVAYAPATFTVAAEAVAETPGRQLALESGYYRAVLRTGEAIFEKTFDLRSGARVALGQTTMERKRNLPQANTKKGDAPGPSIVANQPPSGGERGWPGGFRIGATVGVTAAWMDASGGLAFDLDLLWIDPAATTFRPTAGLGFTLNQAGNYHALGVHFFAGGRQPLGDLGFHLGAALGLDSAGGLDSDLGLSVTLRAFVEVPLSERTVLLHVGAEGGAYILTGVPEPEDLDDEVDSVGPLVRVLIGLAVAL